MKTKNILYKIVTHSKWCKEIGTPAAAVGKTVYLADGFHGISPILLNHELIHIAQQEWYGFDTYMNNYLFNWKNIPYEEKPYEVEAYANAHIPNYIFDKYGYHMVRTKVIDWKNYKEEKPLKKLKKALER